MHDTSFHEMRRLVEKYLFDKFNSSLKLADLGSWNVGGRETSYRIFIPEKWEYVGLDIRGKPEMNVDIIMPTPYKIPFSKDYFDVMISGNTLEHVKNPFKLIKEAARVVKPEGWFIFGAPFVYKPHDKWDGWRFLPKGMRAIFKEAGIKPIESYLTYSYEFISAYMTEKEHLVKEEISDCWFVGRK